MGVANLMNGKHGTGLTLNLLTTTIVAPPSNASKWQMGFNSAFKGLIETVLRHEGRRVVKVLQLSTQRT